ncbi:MAG TPA: hypothetical protein VL633_01275 [Bacteroidota bacterium]|jgi:hypothetical protein|nr:hypothetical protein [Bacteroidota bacterium]
MHSSLDGATSSSTYAPRQGTCEYQIHQILHHWSSGLSVDPHSGESIVTIHDIDQLSHSISQRITTGRMLRISERRLFFRLRARIAHILAAARGRR